jgi:hypothetical protein
VNWKILIAEAIMVASLLTGIGMAYQSIKDTLDQVQKTVDPVPSEIQDINAWRLHLNDYLRYKDPAAASFLHDGATQK